MTASRLLTSVESWGLKLSIGDDGRLVCRGKPSRSVQLLLGLFRAPLLSVLRGQDVPLTDVHPRALLQDLGFVELDTGWTHQFGDEVGYQILCGDIAFETAQAEQAARRRQAYQILASEGLISGSRRPR